MRMQKKAAESTPVDTSGGSDSDSGSTSGGSSGSGSSGSSGGSSSSKKPGKIAFTTDTASFGATIVKVDLFFEFLPNSLPIRLSSPVSKENNFIPINRSKSILSIVVFINSASSSGERAVSSIRILFL